MTGKALTNKSAKQEEKARIDWHYAKRRSYHFHVAPRRATGEKMNGDNLEPFTSHRKAEIEGA